MIIIAVKFHLFCWKDLSLLTVQRLADKRFAVRAPINTKVVIKVDIPVTGCNTLLYLNVHRKQHSKGKLLWENCCTSQSFVGEPEISSLAFLHFPEINWGAERGGLINSTLVIWEQATWPKCTEQFPHRVVYHRALWSEKTDSTNSHCGCIVLLHTCGA